MKITSHPPYLSDFESFNIDLFSYVKICLIGYSFVNAEKFLGTFQNVFKDFQKMTIQIIFFV
jgi:hypothetical protein